VDGKRVASGNYSDVVELSDGVTDESIGRERCSAGEGHMYILKWMVLIMCGGVENTKEVYECGEGREVHRK
jgi:hypothetical protein